MSEMPEEIQYASPLTLLLTVALKQLLPAIAVLCIAGCCAIVDPAPPMPIEYHELPARTRSSFERKYDSDQITQIEAFGVSYWGDCKRDDRMYHFHFKDGGTLALDAQGNPTDWYFDE